MSKAVIKTCLYEHKAQDELHGKQRRVMNFADKAKVFTCTVCGRKYGAKEDAK